MSVPRSEGVHSINETNFVWGAKLTGSNYKSVTIRGELFALGDCVRCPLKSREGHVGKIIKLSQQEGRKMCRIRSFFSTSEFPPSVKGLDCTPEPKELFLASGEGPGVEKDVLLEKIAGRCIILCTAEEIFNEMPSGEQIEAADYFFRRGYDPASEEIVGLDSVEEAIGAQKVYNKKDWLVDKIVGRLTSQVSASRVHCQSPALGSSSHQDAAKGMYSSVPEVSTALSRDSTERKLKRKSDNLVPKPHKVDAVRIKNELHIIKKLKGEMSATMTEKSNARSEHLVFAIQAPSRINSSQRLEVSPVACKPSTSSMSKVQAIQREGKDGSLQVSSFPFSLVGSRQAATKDEGMSAENERKNEDMLTEETPNAIVKFVKRTNASAEREKPSELQKRTDEGVLIATSLVTSTQAGTKCGELISDRQKNKGELSSVGTPNIIFKPVERTNASSGRENPSKFQKRVDEDIATPYGSRYITSAPTLLARKVLPAIKVSTLKPSVMKMSSSIPSLRASKEVLQTDVGSRILKRNDDVPHAPSMRQRQSGSQTLDISFRKGSLSIANDLCHPGSSIPESPRAASSKDLTNRYTDVINLSEPSPSTGAEQKPRGQIFKPRVEDWDISLVPAILNNRVLLLKNLVPGLHSYELAEALTQAMRIRCEVRIASSVSSAYHNTTALLKLPSAKKAQDVIHEMESNYVLVANRLVTATLFNYLEFRAPQLSKYPGHLEFPKEGRDYVNEDYRNAVATSHLAQGNTIEFAFGLPWRVLHEQHEEQWRMLQETHYSNSNDRVKVY